MDIIKVTPRNNNGSMSFTIPSDIAKRLKLQRGDKYVVEVKGESIIFIPENEFKRK
jgi:antitoxin component of MazEF toxin-antitoxin module